MVKCSECCYCSKTSGGSHFCTETWHFVPNIGCEHGKIKQKKEITQAFSQDLLNCDYHIRFGFISENNKTGMYELRFLMQDDFTIYLEIDMQDFDEQQVIKELQEMIEQVYGGDY